VQASRRDAEPGDGEGAADAGDGSFFEDDPRAAQFAPASGPGLEDFRLIGADIGLRFWRKLGHGPSAVRPQGGEDLAADAEVGMTHVLGFDRFRQAEGKLAELGGGHERDKIAGGGTCKVPGILIRRKPTRS
jgi:hypothetical protein